MKYGTSTGMGRGLVFAMAAVLSLAVLTAAPAWAQQAPTIDLGGVGSDVRSDLERVNNQGAQVPLFSLILMQEEGQPAFLVRQQIPGKEMTMVLSMKVADGDKIALRKAKMESSELTRFQKEEEGELLGKWREGVVTGDLTPPFVLRTQVRISHPSKETETVEIPITINWLPTGDEFLRLDCHRQGGSIGCSS